MAGGKRRNFQVPSSRLVDTGGEFTMLPRERVISHMRSWVEWSLANSPKWEIRNTTKLRKADVGH